MVMVVSGYWLFCLPGCFPVSQGKHLCISPTSVLLTDEADHLFAWCGQKSKFSLLTWFKMRSSMSRLPYRYPWQHWPYDLHLLFSFFPFLDSFFSVPISLLPNKQLTCNYCFFFGSSFATSITRNSDTITVVILVLYCIIGGITEVLLALGDFPPQKTPIASLKLSSLLHTSSCLIQSSII